MRHSVRMATTGGVRSLREIAIAWGLLVYSYPQLLPLDLTTIRCVVAVALGVTLLVAVSTRVLRLTTWATIWLLTFATSAGIAALLVVRDISPALGYWRDVERWAGMVLAMVIVGLFVALPTAITQGQLNLIEGVVSFGVSAGLFWVLLPNNGTPIDATRSSHCSNQLRSIAVAIHNDAENRDGELTTTSAGTAEKPPRSWRVELLPYFDQERLRKRYEDHQAWDAPANEAAARTPLHPFVCPNNLTPTDGRKRSYTAYLACTGPSAFFPPPEAGSGRGRRFSEILDGTSHTMMVVEACGHNVVWTEPRDLDVETVPLGINLPGARRGESAGLFSSHDPSGVGVVMGDGSVRRLSADTAPATLKAMLTIDGHEQASFD